MRTRWSWSAHLASWLLRPPPRIDDTHHVVDDGCHGCQRSTIFIASDGDRHFRAGGGGADVVHHGVELRLGQPAPLATQDVGDVLDCAPRVAHHLALDPGGGSAPSEVGPERLATASAQVLGVVLREEQHPPTQAILRQKPQRALVEVLDQSLPGRGFRQHHVFPWCSQEERDQRSEVPRAPHRLCHQSCQTPRTKRHRVEWQGTGSRQRRAAIRNPATYLLLPDAGISPHPGSEAPPSKRRIKSTFVRPANPTNEPSPRVVSRRAVDGADGRTAHLPSRLTITTS